MPIAYLKRSLIRLIESRGYCVSFGEPATFDAILSAFGHRKAGFSFVQIGAFDGKGSDPILDYIRRYRWRGLLIEPQPSVFEALVNNLSKHDGLLFENVAIAAIEGVLPFYTLKDDYAHLFQGQGDHRMLSSLDPAHVLKHLSAPVEAADVLRVTEVPCVPLPKLLDRHGIERIDLLQIDAEGFDFEILKSLDFTVVKPNIVHFEHTHIAQAQKGECIELLVSHDYKLIVGASDITGFRSRWMYV